MSRIQGAAAAAAPTLANIPFKKILFGGMGLALAQSVTSNVADAFRQRFISLNKPSWEEHGVARLYGRHGGTVRYVRGQQRLVDAMFDIPYKYAETRIPGLVDRAVVEPFSKTYKDYKVQSAFNKIKQDPSVQAMGQARARQMFTELGNISPTIVRKAPHTVVPAIQTALVSDSLGIRPDFAQSMTKAEESYKKASGGGYK